MRAQLRSVELLGKVASLTTTTSIIPLAVRVIGIELLFLMLIVGDMMKILFHIINITL